MTDWNRDHDWVLERIYHEQTRVRVRFANGRSSVKELIALRRCWPPFQHISPAELREICGDSGVLELGLLAPSEARWLQSVANEEGLGVDCEDASFISTTPVNRTLGCAWLIEDVADAKAMIDELIAAGVPIQTIYAS